MANNTHTAVHAIQYYDAKTKRQQQIAPGTDFNAADYDFDTAGLVNTGAVKKYEPKAATSKTATTTPAPGGEEGYDAMTVASLKAELDSRGVDYASDARKADLIAALEADDNDEGYEGMTVADLKAELDGREIDYASDALKADLIAALEADDAAE